jgi:hypothetical protein
MSTSRPRPPSLLLAAVAAAAGLAGCAYQDPLSLPPLGSAGSGASSGSPYYGYSGGGYYDPRYRSYDPRYGLYSSYGYYGGGYYDPRVGYYGGGYPGYYGPLPYPPPGYYPYPRGPYCMDANRDGRCDQRGDGHADGNGGHGNGNGGQGPRSDPKRDPFEQVKEVTRRAERSGASAATPTPAVMAPVAPREERPAEPKRSTEPRRVAEPKRNAPPPPSGWKAVAEETGKVKRAPRDDVTRAPPDTN